MKNVMILGLALFLYAWVCFLLTWNYWLLIPMYGFQVVMVWAASLTENRFGKILNLP